MALHHIHKEEFVCTLSSPGIFCMISAFIAKGGQVCVDWQPWHVETKHWCSSNMHKKLVLVVGQVAIVGWLLCDLVMIILFLFQPCAIAWVAVYWDLKAHCHYDRGNWGWLLVRILGDQWCSTVEPIKPEQPIMVIEPLCCQGNNAVDTSEFLSVSVSFYSITQLHAIKYKGMACLQKSLF